MAQTGVQILFGFLLRWFSPLSSTSSPRQTRRSTSSPWCWVPSRRARSSGDFGPQSGGSGTGGRSVGEGCAGAGSAGGGLSPGPAGCGSRGTASGPSGVGPGPSGSGSVVKQAADVSSTGVLPSTPDLSHVLRLHQRFLTRRPAGRPIKRIPTTPHAHPRPTVQKQGFSERSPLRFSRPRRSHGQVSDGLSHCLISLQPP